MCVHALVEKHDWVIVFEGERMFVKEGGIYYIYDTELSKTKLEMNIHTSYYTQFSKENIGLTSDINTLTPAAVTVKLLNYTDTKHVHLYTSTKYLQLHMKSVFV